MPEIHPPELLSTYFRIRHDSVGGRKALRVERVERIGAFDRETQERSFGLVLFRSSAQARYALDLGDKSWYLGSVKMDAYYKTFARDYISPWKLIPLVSVRCRGRWSICEAG